MDHCFDRIGSGLRALCLLGVVFALVPHAAGAQRAWLDGRAVAIESNDPAALQQRSVAVDRRALGRLVAGDQIQFDLFGQERVIGEVARLRVQRPDRYTLSGTIEGVAGGSFVLAVNREATAAVVRVGADGLYRLESSARGPRLVQVDPTLVIGCDLHEADGGQPPLLLPPGGPQTGDGELCGDGSVIDVLVVYTPDARDDAGGVAGIEAEIEMAIEDNNVAYANSGVPAEMRLVYIWGLDIDESFVSLGALTDPEDGIMDTVHQLRDAYSADQVALVESGGGGVANGLWSLSDTSDETAFNITRRESLLSYTLAHEIGHNMGCCHARNDGGGCPADGGLLFEYSNGHRFDGDSGITWRTVMAYSPGARIAHFSNPNVAFDGVATGIDASDPEGADNALTINLSREHVSNYRCPTDICFDLDLPSDAPDCNLNGIPDACDIAMGESADADEDGIPDECGCENDIVADGVVNTVDLLFLLGAFGQCNLPCPADLNGDLVVNTVDLLLLLGDWGDC